MRRANYCGAAGYPLHRVWMSAMEYSRRRESSRCAPSGTEPHALLAYGPCALFGGFCG